MQVRLGAPCWLIWLDDGEVLLTPPLVTSPSGPAPGAVTKVGGQTVARIECLRDGDTIKIRRWCQHPQTHETWPSNTQRRCGRCGALRAGQAFPVTLDG